MGAGSRVAMRIRRVTLLITGGQGLGALAEEVKFRTFEMFGLTLAAEFGSLYAISVVFSYLASLP